MKKITAILLALLMTLSLCACGSAAVKAANSKDYASSGSWDTADYAMEAPAAPAAENYGLSNAAMAAGDSGTAAEGSDTAPETNPDKIIYSSNVTVETTEFDDSLEKLTALIEKYGAWVESSSIEGANYYDQSRGYASNRSASYSIRIPSTKFSTMMNSLSEIGNVPYTHIYTDNVTSQYYDIEARLTAYKTQETTLLEMMEKAETVSDVITIEDRLTELRYEIESLQSTLNNWDRQVSYSTIYLDINEVQEYTPETQAKISYGQELWLALTGALKNTGKFFKNLLVFIVSILPALVILAVLFFVFRPALKKLSVKGKARRAEKLEKKAAKKEAKAAKKEPADKSEE